MHRTTYKQLHGVSTCNNCETKRIGHKLCQGKVDITDVCKSYTTPSVPTVRLGDIIGGGY